VRTLVNENLTCLEVKLDSTMFGATLSERCDADLSSYGTDLTFRTICCATCRGVAAAPQSPTTRTDNTSTPEPTYQPTLEPTLEPIEKPPTSAPVEGTDVNACDAYPCQNGGACTDVAGGASDASGRSCACGDGFSGDSCETDVNACDAYPCQNGGTCTDVAGGAAGATGRTCACNDGYEGVSCDTDVNACNAHPCQNSGACTDVAGGASDASGRSCACADEFTGDSCETPPEASTGGTTAAGTEGDGTHTTESGAAYSSVEVCKQYTNVERILTVPDYYLEIGTGENCRGAIPEVLVYRDPQGRSEVKVDGRKCNRNPYLTCLITATVEECELKCSLDHRCSGYEWNPSAVSGESCVLIESVIPITYGMGTARCHERITKGEEIPLCLERFTADQLSEEMMQCHCAENGDTSGVVLPEHKRVENAYLCPSRPKSGESEAATRQRDDAETVRIKAALANHMFDLCKNWCLFDIEIPNSKYWLWNKNKKCWKKQGKRGLCYKEHVSRPNSIEFEFVKRRSEEFCGDTPHPTPSPTVKPTVDVFWKLSTRQHKSCTAICQKHGLGCNRKKIMQMNNDRMRNDFDDFLYNFMAAGAACEGFDIHHGLEGTAGPGYYEQAKLCYLRDPEATTDPCDDVPTRNYSRLCPCSSST